VYSYGGTDILCVDIVTLLYKPNSHNYASTAVLAMAWSSVAWCRIVFLAAEVSVRLFSTSVDLSRQFGTGGSGGGQMLKYVLGPKFLDTPQGSIKELFRR